MEYVITAAFLVGLVVAGFGTTIFRRLRGRQIRRIGDIAVSSVMPLFDDWSDPLRCPNCGRVGTANIHEEGDELAVARGARAASHVKMSTRLRAKAVCDHTLGSICVAG
jgi:hypothetical protein